MKIIYLLRQHLDVSAEPTWNEIIEEHKKNNDVTTVNIRESKNYDEIVDLIASSDKVISI